MALCRFTILAALKPSVRKYISLILLSCLLLTIFGYHFIYLLRLQEIKAEMKQYLLSTQNKEVTIFRISLSDSLTLSKFQWENENEFSYNTSMYDVLQKKVTGNYLIVYCVPDEKETALIENYKKLNRDNYPVSKEKWASVLKLISTAFVPVAFSSHSYPKSCKRKFYSNSFSLLISRSHNVITPPPELS